MRNFGRYSFGTLEWLVLIGVFGAGLTVAWFMGLLALPKSTPQLTDTAPAPKPYATETPAPAGTAEGSAPTAEPDIAAALPTAAALPQPTPTLFYAAPHTLEFEPTPALPDAAPFPSSCGGPGRMNLLVVGLDGFSNEYQRSARTDTILLVGVNFAARSAEILSLPRDLWLPVPNGLPIVEARLNAAYHYGELYGVAGGGPAQLQATLEQGLGVHVDRYVVVSFLAFEQAIDAIGGIEVDVPEAIHDARFPRRSVPNDTIAIDFPAGRVQMNGATALIYARIRHDSNDFQRMRRQQQVLFAARDRLLQPETLPHLPALAQILFSSVRTNLSWEDVALLGCVGPQIDRAAIQARVVDSSMVEAKTLADGAQVLLPRPDSLPALIQEFSAGE